MPADRETGVTAGDYLIPYTPSSHERAIVSHFGGRVAFDPAAQKHVARDAVVVCFSNRCGSNFLVSALASARRHRKVGEIFNAPAIVKNSEAAGFSSFQEYVESVAAKSSDDDRPLIVKLGWMQLFLLDKWGYLDAVFPDAHFVHIRREDLLGQAISYVIAHSTKAWTSLAEGGGDVAFDYGLICRQVAGFAEANAYFNRFFALTGRPVTRVVYEDFVTDPAGWIAAFGDKIGLPLAYVPERVRLERQDDPRKAEFRARALEMGRSWAWVDAS